MSSMRSSEFFEEESVTYRTIWSSHYDESVFTQYGVSSLKVQHDQQNVSNALSKKKKKKERIQCTSATGPPDAPMAFEPLDMTQSVRIRLENGLVEHLQNRHHVMLKLICSPLFPLPSLNHCCVLCAPLFPLPSMLCTLSPNINTFIFVEPYV